MLKAICLGRTKYDINLVVDRMPVESTSSEFFNKNGNGGGLAANVAVGLSKWGITTAFSGVIGNDVFGNRIKEEFESAHLDMRFLEQSYNNDTCVSSILINKNNGTHTDVNMSDKYIGIKKFDYDFMPDLVMVDGYDVVASKAVLDRFPNAITFFSTNIITKETVDLCRKVKYCICSKEFAEQVSGVRIDFNNMSSLGEVYQKLKKKHLNTEFVILLGEKGALYCVNNQVKISPSLKVAVVDTHGAKDAFNVAFAHMIVTEGDLEKAVKYGCIAAGLATTKLGARPSIPTKDEVKKIYEQNY